MKSLLENNTKSSRIITVLTALIFGISSLVAQDIPPKPSQERTVYDYGGMLNSQESKYFEQKLSQFARETSTQIILVTVESLNGYDKADYAQRLAEEWGIGQKGKDNGILILLQPKTSTQKGEAYIAIGYGLESVVPDAIAYDIVSREMIPSFKQGQIGQGINNAITVLMEITRGEYSAEAYAKQKGSKGGAAGIIVIIIVIFFIRTFSSGSRRHHTMGGRGSSALPWFLMGTMMGGSRSGGSFGNFSGGSGGFGGFGGGGFGGGGAGGSW